MKEIIAIIRPKMAGKTKEALEKAGFPSITARPVLGRGKQRGIEKEVDIDYRPGILEDASHRGMKYIPKRQISIAVKDGDVSKIIETLVGVNRSGEIGDGKIFVLPVEEAIRVRTGETSCDALA
jgi:nitrogen regulatory protein PII 2